MKCELLSLYIMKGEHMFGVLHHHISVEWYLTQPPYYLSQMTGPSLTIATCSGAACTKLQSELAYLKAFDKSFSIPLPWLPSKYVKIMTGHELAALCFC